MAEEADEERSGVAPVAIDVEDAEDTQHALQGAAERWEPSSSEVPAEDVKESEMLEAFDGGLEDAETVADLLR